MILGWHLISRVPLASLRWIVHVVASLILVLHWSVVGRLFCFFVLATISHVAEVPRRIIHIWVSIIGVEVSIEIAIVWALSTLIHFIEVWLEN